MGAQKTEVFILDGAYKAFDVIDDYKEFVWTERYIAHGDFKMIAPPTDKMNALLIEGNYITIPDSDFVMRIETVLDQDKDGERLLTATGRTLTYLLEDRAVSPTWVGQGNVGVVIGGLVHTICKDGTDITPLDAIPGFFTENLSMSTRTIDIKPQRASYLYDVVRSAFEEAQVGFRIIVKKPNGNPQIWFQSYTGVHRPNLVFSVDHDTLVNPAYLRSIENYKNIAYVWHKQGVKIVSRTGISPSVSGYNRKVMPVDATDIEPADHIPTVYNNLLIQRALEAFASDDGKLVELYDGEVPNDIPYAYRKDYFLGDTMMYTGTRASQKRKVRVTEFIRSCDQEGPKAYPTFSVVDQ